MQCFATCKQMIGLFMGFVNNQKNKKYQLTYLMLIRSTFILKYMKVCSSLNVNMSMFAAPDV